MFARLLLGESIDEVVERPFRPDLARIANQGDQLRDELRRAHAKHRTNDLHRIHREIAELFPRVKEISHTLGRSRRRNEAYSPDFAAAAQIEETLNELMNECADAILAARRR